jgi:hypothetical protein
MRRIACPGRVLLKVPVGKVIVNLGEGMKGKAGNADNADEADEADIVDRADKADEADEADKVDKVDKVIIAGRGMVGEKRRFHSFDFLVNRNYY